jgi:3',5'-cyclic AMP phosphodiesterase CpdA
MLIAQITDTHIRAGGALAFGGKVDTGQRLRATVDFLARITPKPTVVLATGDLVDTGNAEDYRELLRLLAPLGIPVLPIPGNHDARVPLRAAFPDIAHRLDAGFIQYVVDEYAVRLVALDTLEEGRIGGRMCLERLAWIKRALADSARPTVLFMHHPPFDSGAAANADMRCEGAEALERIVGQHHNVLAVLCGHLHRSTMRRWAGTVVCTVPATAPTLEFKLDGGHPGGWIDSPPMVGLHLWREGDGLISHVIAVDERERYSPFVHSA